MCKPYAVIQSTYVVVITGGLHLRESADEETNHYEGERASRAVLQQPPYKQPKMLANLEFQLYNLGNAAIRAHALYNSLLVDPSYFFLTGVDAHVSSSSQLYIYNIAE